MKQGKGEIAHLNEMGNCFVVLSVVRPSPKGGGGGADGKNCVITVSLVKLGRPPLKWAC